MGDKKRARLLRRLERLEYRRDVWEGHLPPSWARTQERIWKLRERLGLPVPESVAMAALAKIRAALPVPVEGADR